ncbi:peptidoglycan DD-metalloendopeptidase family protein, partial [Acetobacterium malicum]
KELTDEAEKNGAVMSNEAIAGLDTFGDTVDAIKLSIMGTVGTMASQFVPGLQSLAQLFQENVLPGIAGFVGKIGDLATKFLELDPVTQTIIGSLVGIAVAAGPLLIVGGKIATGVSSIMTVFQGLAPVIAGATTSTTGLGTVLGALTGPIGLTIAAIAAIGAVIAGAWQNSEIFRDSVGMAFLSVRVTIQEAFARIAEAMGPALESFQGFALNVTPILQSIGDFLGIYIVPLVTQFINGFINGFGAIIVAIAPFIAAIGNLLSFIGNFVGMVFALFTGDWASAWTFFQAMGQNACDFLVNIFQGLSNWVILIFQSILDFITNIWNGIVIKTTETWNGITTFLQTTWQAIYDNTFGKITELATTIANKWQETKTDTQLKWDAIKSDLATKWEDIKTNIANKVQEVATNLANKWQETKTDSTTRWGEIRDDLTQKASEIFQNITDKVREIVEDLPGKWQEIKETAGTKWQEVKANIISKIQNLPTDLKNIASDMLNQMVAGIQETAGNVYGAVTSLVNDVITKFKEGFGIHSPARVMLEIGKYIVQGLINGLNGDNLMAFVNNMVEDIKSAFANGNFNLKAAIDFVGSGAAEFFKSIGIGGADFGSLTPPVSGGITSWFGYRDDVGDVGSKYHGGIDIGVAEGTPVGAAGAGTVTQAGWNDGYGLSVTLDHGNGLETLYGHLSEVLVSVGEVVSQLQLIGLSGNTGNSTGPHLHFGVYKDGEAVDPSAIWGYASGTRSAKAGIHWVGEKGPELVGFNGGEAVLNARDSAALAGAGGINQTINIYSPTALSPAKNAKYVKRSLQELLMK